MRFLSMLRAVGAVFVVFLCAQSSFAQTCTGCQRPSFTPAATLASIGQATGNGLLLEDFDNDGNLDAMVGLSLLRGTGRGTFLPPVAAGAYADQPVVADFNGDGILDLAFGDGVSGIVIEFGTPAGGFVPGPPNTSAMGRPVAADFNGDGFPDLIALDPSYPNPLVLLLNDGTGAFLEPRVIAMTDPVLYLAVGDFDGDGIADVAAATLGSKVQILINDGSGNFSFGATAMVPGLNPFRVLARDLNGDGRSDLLVQSADSSFVSGNLAVFMTQGDGSLVSQVLGSVIFLGAAIADVNGDGRPDVLATSSDGISVFFGKTVGFEAPRVIRGLNAIGAITLGDINRDGALDIVGITSGFGSLLVVHGDGSGWFEEPTTLPAIHGANSLASKDFNNDTHPDFVFNNSEGLFAAISTGTGAFNTTMLLPGNFFFFEITIADVNGDGKWDVVVTTDSILVFLGDGAGGFSAPIATPLTESITSLAVADFNGDGKQDVLLARSTSPAVLRLGNGTGAFGPPLETNPGLSGDEIRAADVNGDGKPDVVTRFFNTIRVSLGDGAGHFAAPASYMTNTAGLSVGGLEIGDIDGDGKQDIVVGEGDVEVLRGDGLGGFSAPASYGSPGYTTVLCLADFNRDGILDVVAAPFYDGSTIVILTADGAGGLREPVGFGAEWAVRGVVAADLNGDGAMDLILGFYAGDALALLNSNCVPRRLALSSKPSCSPPGGLLAPAPVVRVYDDGDNVTTCASGQVTVGLVAGSGTPGAHLSGSLTEPLAGGAATFSNLSIDLPGTGYALAFQSAGRKQTRSSPFTVQPSPSAPSAGNDGPVCPGGTIHLTASAVAGAYYRWTGPNGFFSTLRNPVLANVAGADAGLYRVKVLLNGCESPEASTAVNVLIKPSASISAPASACPSLEGLVASVPDAGPGAVYSWLLTNGRITSGQGTRQITFTAGAGPAMRLDASVLAADGCSASGFTTVPVAAPLSGEAAPQLFADGRAVTETLRAGGNMYRAGLIPGHSYVLEVEAGLLGVGPGPARPGLFALPRFGAEPIPFDAADRSVCAPGMTRISFTPDASDLPLYPFDGTARLLLTDCFTQGYPVRVRLVETTLFAPRWSINGYHAFANVQNSCDCSVSGDVTLLDQSGAAVTSLPFSLAGSGSVQLTIPSGLPVLFGSALLAHDGPPGALAGGIYMVNAGSGGANFRWEFREVRDYGATDGR